MLPIQLHIIYKGKKHCKGLIEPDEYSLLQLKNEVVKVTSQDGLTTPKSVQLLVTSPRNNVQVIVDTDAMLRIMFTAHDSLRVPTDADEDESPSKTEGRDEPQIVRNENVYQNVDDNDDDDWLSDFDKEFAADGSSINHQNIAEDAEVTDDGGSSSDYESIDADP
ncbi:hypothetical protein WN944_000873 [Citrus x changshan-huyou]|uniref:Uncharacterized protein n=1 Tax=Citrus x changshan-huyou TaxID=2935761 RepID=A0AAP0MIN4_9ROSI